ADLGILLFSVSGEDLAAEARRRSRRGDDGHAHACRLHRNHCGLSVRPGRRWRFGRRLGIPSIQCSGRSVRFSISIAGFYLWANSRLVSDTKSGTYLYVALVGLALEAVTGAPDIALYVFIAAAVILTATQSSASQMLFRNPVSHFLGNGFIFALPYTLAAITIFVKLGAIPYTEDRLPGRIFLSAADLFGLLGSMRLGELLTLRARKLLERIVLRPAPPIAGS
ncbi:hypothetical protein J2X71_007631, partial [Rhizobium sp. 1399]|nr:hypothetical protein [Rhizobium sp. 1399]